jgi:hypothetical protein
MIRTAFQTDRIRGMREREKTCIVAIHFVARTSGGNLFECHR